MTNHENRPTGDTDVRQKAEALARQRGARLPEDNTDLSAEEIRKTLHELQVQKIQLEMQNEALRAAQDQIEAGRARYFDLYDLAPVGYCTLSEQGLILEANLTAATLLGTTRGALDRQPISRFICKDDRDICYLHCKKLFETGNPRECELRMVKPDGTVFWVLLNGIAAQSENGEPFCRVMLRDITDRKQVEERLRNAEWNLRSTVDGLSAHIAVFDDRGEIVLTNKAYRDFGERNGIDPTTVSEGTNYLAICDTVSGEYSQEAKPFAEAIREVISGKRQSFALEYPCHSSDEKRWFIGRVTPFAGEGPRRVIVAHENITERKQAEETLKASEELLAETESIGKVGGWSFNIDTMEQTWTKEVYRIHEVEIEPYPSVEAGINYYTTESRPIIEKAVKRAIAHGEDYDLELAIITAKGNTRAVHTIGKADLKNRRIYGFFQDITERKLAETYHEMGREMLQILNEPGDLRESIQRVLVVLKTQTGADAVGLRLQEGEDFPYFAQDGFSTDFLMTENTLVERDKDGGLCRDKDGNVRLECTCGLVISGKTDPASPLFSPGGSSWTNDSFPVLDLPSDRDPRLHPRNNCIHQGYASVALIPIRIPGQMYSRETCIRHGFGSMAHVPVRTSDRIVGLIQVNDKRKGRFTPETIEILEGIAAHVGSALMRKQAEDALRESENQYRILFENMNVSFAVHEIICDDNGEPVDYRFLEMNPMFLKNIGKTAAEVQGHTATELFPNTEQHWFDTFGKVAETGESISYQNYSRELEQWFDIFVFSPQKGQFAAFFIDITERKQAEAEREKLQAQLTQAQKMESVGRLAGGVAHDFNNMLAVILGNADMILEKFSPDQPFHEELTEIRKAAERSANLTRQLLAFARKQTISPRVLDFNESIESMLQMLRRLIGEDIDLVWRPGRDVWPVRMDPAQIDQILANLCVNARDAIADVGKVTIETGTTVFDEDYCMDHAGFLSGEYVLLAVSDDGCGIDKEVQTHLFEPFFTTKGVGKGTGLGLATVYGIVKQNNGFINFYSELGQGTTFRIYLPRHQAKTALETEKRYLPATKGGNETVLLVEDEPAILKVTIRMLVREGYTVLAAGTPGEAIHLANEHAGDIQILISDVVMPEMNGRDLARNILSLYPHVKCLFMSGYTANVIAHHGVLDKGVHFIQKPFSKGDLTRTVRDILDG